MGLLDHAGARLTGRPEDADILVVNTCSFIDTAKQESVDTILEMARHKTEGRAKKLIVAGCLVERYGEEIRRNIPEVDAVVGTGELELILEAAGISPVARAASPFNILTGVTTARAGQESLAGTHKVSAGAKAPVLSGTVTYGLKSVPFAETDAGAEAPDDSLPQMPGIDPRPIDRIEQIPGMNPRPTQSGPTSRAEGDLRERQGRFTRETWQGAAHMLPTYLYDENTPRLLTTGRTSAYIKIAEGCDHPCTFCVIPNLRGKFRSRRFESVVAEAQRLVGSGVREITLIGQDTTCYGEDLGLKDGLALLLDELAKIEGLRWLRFLYAYPNRITGRLLETIAKHDNICKYLDVPLQHASPAVLKTMKRGAGAEIFLKTLCKVRAAVPGIALRTSFIVGFPGETDADVARLEEFVKEARFDWMGVFSYSDEEGSGAHGLAAKVPKRTIEARRKRLMKLQQGISKRAKQEWVGREVVVLAEGESAETELLWEGRTEFHAPDIDGKVYINDFGPMEALEKGRFYRAEITEAHEYDLVARVVSEAV